MLDDLEVIANRNGASNDIKDRRCRPFAANIAHGCGAISDDHVTAVNKAGYSDAEIVAEIAVNIFTGTANVARQTDID